MQVLNMVTLIDNRNADVSLADVFINKLIPLYKEYWDLTQRNIYEEDFNPQLQALINMWLGGAIKIFTLSDNDTMVGFCICLIYRPITYNSTVLQLKDIYCKPSHAHMYQELVNYIEEACRFFGCTEIQSNQSINLKDWEERTSLITKRYRLIKPKD